MDGDSASLLSILDTIPVTFYLKAHSASPGTDPSK
jgi:hypothetical protein